MKNIVQVDSLLPVLHKKISPREVPLCSIYRFQAYRLRSFPSDEIRTGVEFMLKSDQGERLMVYCYLPEPGLIKKIKWYAEEEIDGEMSEYVVKAFILKFLSKNYHLKLNSK